MPDDSFISREPRRAAAPNKRRARIQGAGQPDLFAARGDAWLARHWPAYAPGRGHKQEAAPLTSWAATFDALNPGARLLLITLAQDADRDLHLASIAMLARATWSSQQATRQRIDRLLAAGLIMVRLWTDTAKDGRPMPLGYEFRLLVDEDHRAAALAEGFMAKRDSGRRATTGARCS